MTAEIETEIIIVVPVRLAIALNKLVADCAKDVGESPETFRRAMEITILQRGLASLRDELRRTMQARMDWDPDADTATDLSVPPSSKQSGRKL